MPKFHDLSSGSLAQSSSAAPDGGALSVAELHRAGIAAADPLSDVLRTVRLTGALFFLWDVSWPYATPVPNGASFAPIILPGAQQIISYHIVTEGVCWAGLIGESPVRLGAGDILLIPHGDAYVIASSRQRCAAAQIEAGESLRFFRQMAAGELPFVIADGGGGDTSTRLVCGFLGCDLRPFNPALAALPPLVHVRAPTDLGSDRLQSLIEFTVAEAREPRAGGRCVVARVGELMFVEVLRRCLTGASAPQSGWLAGLRDPVVGRALQLLHGSPSAAWKLERLASEVGVSRSRLAEAFTRVVGQPPMLYLTQWRLQIAARLLADGAGKVSAVAHEVGYDSEAAFSRAFKRFTGVSPAQWRRDAIRGEGGSVAS